ncbi:MAG: outer membrane protein assembly factor BamA, partial [Magnetococcales bacterium]|nr:outer membrane protein assembly factor BamA [Magnetococcales bacterium]
MKARSVTPRLIVLLSVCLLLLSTSVPSLHAEETIRDIRVEGIKRIESETIRSYLTVDVGSAFNKTSIQQSIQALFKTGFFKDVAIDREGSALIVKVVENPTVDNVKYEGHETFTNEELEKLIKIKPHSIYNRARSERDLSALRQAYRIKGMFLADIQLKVEQKDQNLVDLIYEIDEGQKSKVRVVRFIGNKKLSDGDLQKKLLIQPSDWLSWFTEKDTYDRNKLLYDQNQVRNTYLDNGYIRVQVNSSVAELTPDREAFIITHSVTEGERYRVGSIRFQSNFDELPEEELRKQLAFEPGEWYSRLLVRDTKEALNDVIGDFGYAFLAIQAAKLIDDEKRVVDIVFNIDKGRRVYVNRINISGNDRTRDEVIRREVQLVEGDRFSPTKIRTTEKRLKGLQYFEKVDLITPERPDKNDRINIDIDVAEKPTGSFTMGLGYSSVDNLIGSASISQNNFLGKGQRLSLSVNSSSSSTQYDLSFTEPYFLDKNIMAGFDIYNKELERESTAFKQNTWGGNLRLGFPISEFFRNDMMFSMSHIKVENKGNSNSAIILDQAARSPFIQSMVRNVLYWNDLDNMKLPRSGRTHNVTTDFSGIGGDVKFFRLINDNNLYHTLSRKHDLILRLRGKLGVIEGWGGEDTPIFERFYLGGPKSMRGFKSSGVGPRTQEGDAFGGTYLAHGSAEFWVPFYGLGDKGVRWITYTDTGVIGDW